MLVGRIRWLSNMLGWPEGLFIASIDLSLSVLLAEHGLGSLLERIADGCVGWLAEQDAVDVSLLARTCLDIGWVDLNLLGVSVGDESC